MLSKEYRTKGEVGMGEIIKLKPVFKEAIWGGEKLRTDFHYDIPSDKTGECWAISAHQNGDCEIDGGTYDGKRLSWLWDQKRELFGNIEGDRFPLLIKIIDAKDDLSIQVHPDDLYAHEKENGSFGKTECWYILDCEEDATIIVGHNAKNKEELKQLIEEKKWNQLIREKPIHRGDFFQITPGTVHAIKKGTVILETQQNSDITYRLYDYDRLQNGKPRELHLQKSIDVIQCPYKEQNEERVKKELENGIMEELVSCEFYTVDKLTIEGKNRFTDDYPFVIMSIIDGSGTLNDLNVNKGDHFILPSGFGDFTMDGKMQIIISHI